MDIRLQLNVFEDEECLYWNYSLTILFYAASKVIACLALFCGWELPETGMYKLQTPKCRKEQINKMDFTIITILNCLYSILEGYQLTNVWNVVEGKLKIVQQYLRDLPWDLIRDLIFYLFK